MIHYLHRIYDRWLNASQWHGRKKSPYFLSFPTLASILVLTVIGLSLIQNYGITWDEPTEVGMIEWNINFVMQGKPIPSDLRYYGTFFNGLAELVFQVKQYLVNGLGGDSIPSVQYLGLDQHLSDRLQLYLAKIEVKHYVTFLFSLITYCAIAEVLSILISPTMGWIGVISLALIPQFWGQSFFNPKDIPFAAWMTLVTVVNAYGVNFLCSLSQKSQQDKNISEETATDPKLQFKNLIQWGVSLGIVWGLLAGIRMPGLFVGFFFFLTYFLVSYKHPKPLLSLLTIGFVSSMTTYLTIVFLYPSSWQSPLTFIVETLSYFASHQWNPLNHFQGQFIPAQQVPWTYLPVWYSVSIPEIFLLLCCIGLVISSIKYQNFSPLQQSSVLLLGLQLVFFPLVAIVKHSTIYDGLRQFLFTLPSLVTFSVIGLVWIFQVISDRIKPALVILILIIGLDIIQTMVQLYPYEYIYFNRLSGGLPTAKANYETDYWGLSIREAIAWINSNLPPKSVIFTDGAFSTTLIQSSPNNITLLEDRLYGSPANVAIWKVSEDPIQTQEILLQQEAIALDLLEQSQHFYYLAIPRFDYPQRFSQCPIVYEVQRQGVGLSLVRECEVVIPSK